MTSIHVVSNYFSLKVNLNRLITAQYKALLRLTWVSISVVGKWLQYSVCLAFFAWNNAVVGTSNGCLWASGIPTISLLYTAWCILIWCCLYVSVLYNFRCFCSYTKQCVSCMMHFFSTVQCTLHLLLYMGLLHVAWCMNTLQHMLNRMCIHCMLYVAWSIFFACFLIV